MWTSLAPLLSAFCTSQQASVRALSAAFSWGTRRVAVGGVWMRMV
jgi:hypothetical protein